MKFHIEMDKVHGAREEQVADTADDQPFSPNHESWLQDQRKLRQKYMAQISNPKTVDQD